MSVGELIDVLFFAAYLKMRTSEIYLIETALKESYQKFKRV